MKTYALSSTIKHLYTNESMLSILNHLYGKKSFSIIFQLSKTYRYEIKTAACENLTDNVCC